MKEENPYNKPYPGVTGNNQQAGRFFDIRDQGDPSTRPAVVDCIKCKYYYVTWEPSFPRGCKLFGFKSKQLPCDVVRESTGQPCQQFERRNARNS